MRTQEQIDEQIKGIESMKEWLPEYSAFGDNNWEAMDLQIEILKGNTTSDDIDTDEDEDSTLYNSALDAEEWLNNDNADALWEKKAY